MKTLLSFLLILTLITVTFSQTQITGKIFDKSNNEPLIGAVIKIKNTNLGTISDYDGNYTLEVPTGKSDIEISYISFITIGKTIELTQNQTLTLDFSLEASQGQALKEVVIATKVERSASVATLIERKNSSVVMDGISSESIKKTPDRTTSDVLKRVTGASIQEGKFAIIRGMNDRYNVGYLDGSLLPSSESDRKAFAFDAIPASLIDNILILKAGTSDLVGDFGGGVIKINTKSIPTEFTQNVSLGLQSNSLTTFKDFKEFKRYSGEQFNILSKDRVYPNVSDNALRINSTYPTADEKSRLATETNKFNNDWTNRMANAMPNNRFSYTLGVPFKISEGRNFGVLVSVNYSNTKKYSDASVNSFDGSGQVASFNDKVYSENFNTSGLLNFTYKSENTELNFRNLLNASTDNNVIERSGIGSINDDIRVQGVSNIINYNKIYNGVLSWNQKLGNYTLNSIVSLAYVNRVVPDYKIANYTKTPDFDDYQLSLGDFFNSSSGRFTSNLNEKVYSANTAISRKFESKLITTDIKVGLFAQNRDRLFTSRNFVYNGNATTATKDPSIDLSSENINANKLYLIEKTSVDISNYGGKSDIYAAFICTDQKIKEKLRIGYGLRYEQAKINVFNQVNNSEISNINNEVLLPSINTTYQLNTKTQLRASYFSSVNRPEFRELAPFAFYVFDKNSEIRGNKDLKTARLNNYDARLEFFPTSNQLLSIGTFYKTLNNPIEQSIDITQPFQTFTYQNEKSATIYGIELEMKKRLDFLGENKIINRFSIYSNFTLSKSTLQFEEGTQATQNRNLQGQSPYIINSSLQYDITESGWFFSAGLNRVGRRIAFAGVDKKFGATRQDIYEAPRTVVDIQVSKQLGKFNLKLTLGDILRQNQVFYQDTNSSGRYEADQDLKMYQYNFGMNSTLNLTYNF